MFFSFQLTKSFCSRSQKFLDVGNGDGQVNPAGNKQIRDKGWLPYQISMKENE